MKTKIKDKSNDIGPNKVNKNNNNVKVELYIMGGQNYLTMRCLNYFYYIFSKNYSCPSITIKSVYKLEGIFANVQHTILAKDEIEALINKSIISFPYCVIRTNKNRILFSGNPVDDVVKLNNVVKKYFET